MSVNDFFGTLGVILNLCVFSAEIPLMRRLFKERDASRYSWYPAASLAAATSLWSAYTLWVRPTVTMYLANFTGLFAALAYMTCYALFSKGPARKRIAAAAVGIGVHGFLLYAVLFAIVTPFERAESICGSTNVAVNLIFYVAPLRQIRIALRDLDTTRVPVALSVLQFLGATTWAINGVLMQDTFILIPNSFGSAMGALQLALLAYIRHKAQAQGKGKAPAAADAGATTAAVEMTAGVDGKGGLAAADGNAGTIDGGALVDDHHLQWTTPAADAPVAVAAPPPPAPADAWVAVAAPEPAGKQTGSGGTGSVGTGSDARIGSGGAVGGGAAATWEDPTDGTPSEGAWR